MQKQIIGSEEWLALPGLELPAIKARIDSGAKTSSLHAYNIYVYEQDTPDGPQDYVRFDIHPIQKNRRLVKRCRAPILGQRTIRSSNGEEEQRIVIKTPVKLGENTWDIEVTLTNRDAMGYRMLLGREAMLGRILVDPSLKFGVNNIEDKAAEQLYKNTEATSKPLKVGLLASNPELYSNKRIMEAGTARGHKMQFINVNHCYMNISDRKGAVHYNGQILDDLDAVIPRIKPSVTFYGCSVLRQFEYMGIFCLNDASSITNSRDKLRSLQILSSKNINMPVTGFANSPQDTKELIKMVGEAPLVIKLLEGTQGRGVVLAETNKAATSVISAFKSLKANILVQEFIKDANGSDFRAFVINGKVMGAMKRQAPEGEFRANVHLGATVSSVKLTATEKKTAIAAAKAMGLTVAGVDLIPCGAEDKGVSKVLEVNSSPGLEGIERATGLDIAGMMFDAIEKNVKRV